MKINNNFLLVNVSPWPMMTTMSIMNLAMQMIFSMSLHMTTTIMITIMMIINSLNMWMLNSNTTKFINGYKNLFTNVSMKILAIMFILSESMFFSTFFYVMKSNKMFNIFFSKKFELTIFKLSFIMSSMNLIILLSSSVSMMIFVKKNKMNNKSNLFSMMTMILSLYFIMIQLIEYQFMSFEMTNSVFFSTFYLLTMFHMSHVILGTMMIMSNMIMKMIFINNMFIKMMFTCWYWHFVDLIWVIIFFSIY